jgi:hypothetical protein
LYYCEVLNAITIDPKGGRDMASITKLRELVGMSEGDLINKSLISFVEREIKCAEEDIADIRERYAVFSKEELYEAIKSKQIASHPAWEDYIVWENKEKYIADLKGQVKPVSNV